MLHVFCCPLIFFFKINFFEKKSPGNTTKVSNSLDQARCFIGPGLCANCLQMISANDTSRNKSAAGMQHTPPRNIFNAKKIILKLDLFMQSLKKIGKEMSKVKSENPIYDVNQGPQLCSYLSKLIHLQYQDTTFQYQLLYPV